MPLLTTGTPPVGQMTGPPAAPPDNPSLSAFRPTPDSGSPGPGQAGALPRLFFQAEQAIDAIASAVPGGADDLDRIKEELKDVLRKVMSGGASKMGPRPDEQGLPTLNR